MPARRARFEDIETARREIREPRLGAREPVLRFIPPDPRAPQRPGQLPSPRARTGER